MKQQRLLASIGVFSITPRTPGRRHRGLAMSDLRRRGRRFGLSLLVGSSRHVFGLTYPAWPQVYPPNGRDTPTITLNEGQEGAAGLPPLTVPPPNGFDQQS